MKTIKRILSLLSHFSGLLNPNFLYFSKRPFRENREKGCETIIKEIVHFPKMWLHKWKIFPTKIRKNFLKFKDKINERSLKC